MKKILLGIVIFILLVVSIWEFKSHQRKYNRSTYLMPLYQGEIKKYASGTPIEQNCAKLNFKTFDEALKNQASIVKANPEISNANFNNHFLLLRSPMSTTSLWFIAECKTGKFIPVTIPASMIFSNNDSPVAVLNPPNPLNTFTTFRPGANGLPKLIVWKDSKWDVLPNPIQ
jgi:uncharacterized protein YxeA